MPAGVHHQPNRPPRLQPRFPAVEKRNRKLPFKSAASEKANFNLKFKAETVPYSMCQPPAPPVIVKPVARADLFGSKPDVAQFEVAPESFDLLDQLEMAVAESLGAGKEMVAKAVADSWRSQV